MNFLFVYGTLKQGRGNNHYLKNQKFIGKAETSGPFKLYTAGIPFLVYDESFPDNTIHGELYEVDDEALKYIDRLEGHPTLYMRRVTIANVKDRYFAAEAYFYPKDNLDVFHDFLEEIVDF